MVCWVCRARRVLVRTVLVLVLEWCLPMHVRRAPHGATPGGGGGPLELRPVGRL